MAIDRKITIPKSYDPDGIGPIPRHHASYIDSTEGRLLDARRDRIAKEIKMAKKSRPKKHGVRSYFVGGGNVNGSGGYGAGVGGGSRPGSGDAVRTSAGIARSVSAIAAAKAGSAGAGGGAGGQKSAPPLSAAKRKALAAYYTKKYGKSPFKSAVKAATSPPLANNYSKRGRAAFMGTSFATRPSQNMARPGMQR